MQPVRAHSVSRRRRAREVCFLLMAKRESDSRRPPRRAQQVGIYITSSVLFGRDEQKLEGLMKICGKGPGR